MKNLVQLFTETTGPSGFEDSLRELVRREIADHVDEMRVDALGNLIARKGSRGGGGRTIMLSAHLDEIGLIVTHVDENGFARFTSLGYVDPRTCLGSRVRFANGIGGVIGSDRLSPGEHSKLETLYIDTGATGRGDSPVRVGDVAAFERPFQEMGDRWVAKAMDDRVCVALLVETLRQLKETPHEIYAVFTVQEEVGIRGATTAAYGVDPEIGLALDVTGTGDTPKSSKMEVSLGKGPAIKVKDSGMLADARVVRWMVEAAERRGLPYQLEILEGGTTDARAMQLTRAGVIAGCLSIPCRYVHSPSEMIDAADLQNGLSLLLEMLSGPVPFE